MIGRPCKPDADLKRLWQMLMPGTHFPACGMPENHDADSREIIGTEAPSRETGAVKLLKP
jgi:hypothetical protein